MSDVPVRASKCATCPFRKGSRYAYLAPSLTLSAMVEASRICHSTGEGNAINRKTGKPPHLCRGARDVQLAVMFAAEVIAAPTDDAWNAQRAAIGMKPQAVKDPE